MDFELSEEQEAFRKVIREFVGDHIRPVAREWEHSGRYPTEIVDKMKQMGLFGITVPEEYGGLGLDTVSMALVFEEISRGWMGIAGIIGSHSLTCRMIARAGTDEQKQRWLPKLATGEVHAPFATASITSFGAPRPGSPTRATPACCRCSSRPIPPPSRRTAV